MKRTYTTTDETRKVLAGHEPGVAKAKGCCPSYIYNVKNAEEPDPFPPFRKWFQQCAIGGAPVHVYLHDLECIAVQAERGHSSEIDVIAKLINKLDADAETSKLIAAANADGFWDARECEQILNACDRLESETRELREMALMATHITPIRSYARAAVNARRK